MSLAHALESALLDNINAHKSVLVRAALYTAYTVGLLALEQRGLAATRAAPAPTTATTTTD